MNCMKCGREIPEQQTFCDVCLEVMSQYPVNPHTPPFYSPYCTTFFDIRKEEKSCTPGKSEK